MIPVTKPYEMNRERVFTYLNEALDRGWLTNEGPLVQELTKRLKEIFGVKYLLVVSNGTLALQIAYKAVGIHQKAITTPFSFVATTSSLDWNGVVPVFVDIEDQFYTLSADNLVQLSTAELEGLDGIVPTHVYGNACDVQAIDAFAQEKGLKVVYDAAHAAFTEVMGRSILSYGDASVLSLHATKLFHAVEGGVIVFKHEADYLRAKSMMNFGLVDGHVVSSGMNAKMSEFHAAVGLSNLDDIPHILEKRRQIWTYYQDHLVASLAFQRMPEGCTANYSYAPVLFETEELLLSVIEALEAEDIYPRRYFYPSLHTLPYVEKEYDCKVSEDISKRILCLPLYVGMTLADVQKIVDIINEKCLSVSYAA